MSKHIVESIIRREGGTKVTLGATLYHFKPDEDGRHVAEVSNMQHLQRFMSIPEGFRLVGDDETGDTDLSGGLGVNEDNPPDNGERENLLNRVAELSETDVVDWEGYSNEQLEEAIAEYEQTAQEDEGAGDEPSGDDQGQGDSADEGDKEEQAQQAAAAPEPGETPLERQDPATVDEAALRARFEEVIGEKAHPRMKVENIQARIIETVEAVEGDD